MFWSANYMSMRELNFLLKEENVTLTQILEADDILQECKADNKDLIKFLTRPEILAELINLITEEPSQDLELSSQYRHSNIACEVLTSQLSGLSHRLCMDVVQMNKLCDFVSQEPPLNPLLASYFSRTIETFLKRSPKQDCYLHHILCLRAFDFFKARKDFLPNLLKHIATSAIADTLKFFIFCLGEPFKKVVIEWLDEHQFLENLIQIVCCNYEVEEIEPIPVHDLPEPPGPGEEHSEKIVANHKDSVGKESQINEWTRRLRASSSASASALACEVLCGWGGDSWSPAGRCAADLSARMRSEPLVRALLQGCFTSPLHLREHALLNGCRLLRALADPQPYGEESSAGEEQRQTVERAVAPHLPLLHHALMQAPPPLAGAEGRARVGAARVQMAALVAELARSQVQDVHTAVRSLGTAVVLLDMFFAFPENNFLHAQVCALLHNIGQNEPHADLYWEQLVREADLLTRLMDTFEQNEDAKCGARAGLMGHVVCACRQLASTGAAQHAPPAVAERWLRFLQARLDPLLARLDAPLGGEYPSECVSYDTVPIESVSADTLEMESGKEAPTLDAQHFGEDMWEDVPEHTLDLDEARQLASLQRTSPWEQGCGWEAEGEEGDGEGDGECESWAQFDDATLPPVDPFATPPLWAHSADATEGASNAHEMDALQAELNRMEAGAGGQLSDDLLSAINNLVLLSALGNPTVPIAEPLASHTEAAPSETSDGQEEETIPLAHPSTELLNNNAIEPDNSGCGEANANPAPAEASGAPER